MSRVSRDEFLSHVHNALSHPRIPGSDPPRKKGSPTKSTQRARWRELLSWDVEAEASEYWDALGDGDKQAPVTIAGYWDFTQLQLDTYSVEITSEPALRDPFSTAFRVPQNIAIQGAADCHAEMRVTGTDSEPQPLAYADFFMVYDGKVCGLIELKTWWKVTEEEINQVRDGNRPSTELFNRSARAGGWSASWPSCS